MRAALKWSATPEVIGRGAVAYGERLHISVIEFAEVLATLAEREARVNAPWRDRTGDARRGLHAFVEQSRAGLVRVTLAHGVSYGIYLEIKQAGRWGIVVKTLERVAPAWAAFVRSVGF